MKINNTEIEISSHDNKTTYSFFACSCKDEDSAFYDEQMIKVLTDDDYSDEDIAMVKKFPLSNFTYLLQGMGWGIDSIYADQWMMICLESHDGKSTLDIQCDIAEYGLTAACLIIEKLGLSNEE